MAISDLIAVVPPPANPIDAGSDEQWEAVQRELGIRLPSDLYDFARTYGRGFFEVSETEIRIWHPFDSGFVRFVKTHLDDLAEFHEADRKHQPYPPYPSNPGAFPWGGDVNGHNLYWLVRGQPETWPVLTGPHEGDDWEIHDGPMTSFLAAVFTRRIATSLWPSEYFADLKELRFQPRQFVWFN